MHKSINPPRRFAVTGWAAAPAALQLVAIACAPSRPPDAIPPPAASLPDAPPDAPAPAVAAAPAEPDALLPFTWDRMLIAGWDVVDGPGIETAAQEGRVVSILADDGSTRSARVTEAQPCDEEEKLQGRAFCYVAIEFDEVLDEHGETEQPDQFLSPWSRPGIPENSDGAGNDLALLPAGIAVPADTALPTFVPSTIEVRYANALCESEADDGTYVLVRAYSSEGTDPVAGFSGLRKLLRHPRRTITVRVVGRTFHFVTVSKLRFPRSGRMFDIPRRYDTEFWILEEDGDRFEVRHHHEDHGGRNINQDASCSLPLDYPAPWGVVEVDGVISVLTRESLSTFARWSIRPDGIAADASWKADVNPI
jgi:hypothetical protein